MCIRDSLYRAENKERPFVLFFICFHRPSVWTEVLSCRDVRWLIAIQVEIDRVACSFLDSCTTFNVYCNSFNVLCVFSVVVRRFRRFDHSSELRCKVKENFWICKIFRDFFEVFSSFISETEMKTSQKHISFSISKTPPGSFARPPLRLLPKSECKGSHFLYSLQIFQSVLTEI